MNVISNLRKCNLIHLKCNNICKIHCCKYSSLTLTDNDKKTGNTRIDYIKNKIHNVMKSYEQITGLDEIRAAQNRVIEVQERFAVAQDKRREATIELNNIKTKIKDLQEERTILQGEDRLKLVDKVFQLSKEEIRLTDKFNFFEREERELFSTLTSAVKDSHEKERIQANKTKYFSIIGSVIGALIGILGSSLNNSKFKEFKKLVRQIAIEDREELKIVCEELKLTLANFNSLNMVKSNEIVNNKLSEMLSMIKKLENNTLNLKHLELTANPVEKNIETSVQDKLKNLASNNKLHYTVISCFSVYFLYRIVFP